MNRIINYYTSFKRIIKSTTHDVENIKRISDDRYRRLLLTGGSSALVKLISGLINLITIPLTVNYLGSERYGLWMAISSILAFMSFADLGLGNGLLSSISKANGSKSKKDAQIAVSSSFFILLGISSILFLFFTSLFPFFSWKIILNIKTPLAIQESGPTVIVLVVMLLINMPLGIIQRIQEGYQEGYNFQIWLILGSLISFISLLLCIYLKTGLPWLVLASSGGQLIATILNGINLFSRKRQYLKPKIKYFNLEIGKQLIKSGSVFLLLGILTLMVNASDAVIIAQTIGVSSVAGYEIVKKLFFFTMFTAYFVTPLWPAFGEAIESGDLIWAKNTFRKATKLSIISGVVISFPLLLFGKQIISIWIGKSFTPSWSLLVGFYLYIILNNYIGVMSTLINSNNLVKKLVLPMSLNAVFSIMLKIYFSQIFGVSGIIWATIIGWGIFFVIPSYYLSKSIFLQKSKV